MSQLPLAVEHRQIDHLIEPLIYQRWSPRAMNGESIYYVRARIGLQVPADYAVAAMFAVGRPGDPDRLPEKLRRQEIPSGRRPVLESIQEGPFKASVNLPPPFLPP